MSRYAHSLIVVTALGLLLATGCATTFIKRQPHTPEPSPSKALLAGFNIRTETKGGGTDLVAAAVNAAQNSTLEKFGPEATQKLIEMLASKGYQVSLDGERAKKLDLIHIDGGAAMAALTGSWKNPETSGLTPMALNGMFAGGYREQVVGKIKVEGQKEYYVFTEIVVRESGFVWIYPQMVIETLILDDAGKPVLHAQGVGDGDGSVFFVNRSPENLGKALDRAFAALDAAQPENI